MKKTSSTELLLNDASSSNIKSNGKNKPKSPKLRHIYKEFTKKLLSQKKSSNNKESSSNESADMFNRNKNNNKNKNKTWFTLKAEVKETIRKKLAQKNLTNNKRAEENDDLSASSEAKKNKFTNFKQLKKTLSFWKNKETTKNIDSSDDIDNGDVATISTEIDEIEEPSTLQMENQLKNDLYTFGSFVKHSILPINAIQFNQSSNDECSSLFAAIGGSRVLFYKCNQTDGIKFYDEYVDNNKFENFRTCDWSVEITNDNQNNNSKNTMLAFGGDSGHVKSIRLDTKLTKTICVIKNTSINQLKFHLKDNNLLFILTKDSQIFLINIQTNAYVFKIPKIVDFRPTDIFNIDNDGRYLIASGKSNNIYIWLIDKGIIRNSINKSYVGYSSNVEILNIRKPLFQIDNIHNKYTIIDCIRWHRNIIISKGTDEQIICWKILDFTKSLSDLTNKIITKKIIKLRNCGLFTKFNINYQQNLLSVGNDLGTIIVHDLNVSLFDEIPIYELKHKKCNDTIVDIQYSNCGNILIALCCDGSIWHWNKIQFC